MRLPIDRPLERLSRIGTWRSSLRATPTYPSGIPRYQPGSNTAAGAARTVLLILWCQGYLQAARHWHDTLTRAPPARVCAPRFPLVAQIRMREWSRSDKIAFASLFVGVLGITIAYVVPAAGRLVGLGAKGEMSDELPMSKLHAPRDTMSYDSSGFRVRYTHADTAYTDSVITAKATGCRVVSYRATGRDLECTFTIRNNQPQDVAVALWTNNSIAVDSSGRDLMTVRVGLGSSEERHGVSKTLPSGVAFRGMVRIVGFQGSRREHLSLVRISATVGHQAYLLGFTSCPVS